MGLIDRSIGTRSFRELGPVGVRLYAREHLRSTVALIERVSEHCWACRDRRYLSGYGVATVLSLAKPTSTA